MSDTISQSTDTWADKLANALTSPGVSALLGMTQGFAQAAMPTRVPTPFMSALGMGLGGLQGGINSGTQVRQNQQGLLTSRMKNTALASELPLLLSKNATLANMWAHPELMQQMMNGGTPIAPSVPGVSTGPSEDGGLLPASTYAQRIQGSENATGNPAQRNMSGPGGTPTSTAMGNGQFIEGTWLPLFKATFPDRAAGMTDAQILVRRADPADSTAMTNAYAQQNSPVLQQAGVTPHAGNLAMAHRYGPEGAIAIAQASPGTPLASLLSPAAMTANPTWTNMTAGQARGNAAMQFSTAPVDFSASSDLVTPAQALAKSQQLEMQANALHQRQEVAKYWQQQGAPVFAPPGDPALIRAEAAKYRELALAGPLARASAAAKATVDVQSAGPIAEAQATAKVGPTLKEKGFDLLWDGTIRPTPGGEADPAYIGQTAATKAYSTLGPSLMEKGFLLGEGGTLIPMRGGPNDPVFLKEKAAAETRGKSENELIHDRFGNAYTMRPDGTWRYLGRGAEVKPVAEGGKIVYGDVGGVGIGAQTPEGGPAHAPVQEAPNALEAAIHERARVMGTAGIAPPLPGAAVPSGVATSPISGTTPPAAPTSLVPSPASDAAAQHGSILPSAATPPLAVQADVQRVAPGVTTRTIPGGGTAYVDRRATLEKNYEADMKDVETATDEANSIQGNMARLYEMRTLVDRLPEMGSGGQFRAGLANIVETYIKPIPGIGKSADAFLHSIGNLPDAAAAQEFAKLSLQAAGLQEKSTVGARGSLGLTKLFLQANPNIDLQPDAGRAMANFLLVQHQMELDYLRGLHNHVQTQGSQYRAGGEYEPAQTFDDKWLSQDNQKTYVAATEALSGRDFKDWSKLLSGNPAALKATLGIVQHIDPTATVHWNDGTIRPVSSQQAPR